jgi:hypothetical protein
MHLILDPYTYEFPSYKPCRLSEVRICRGSFLSIWGMFSRSPIPNSGEVRFEPCGTRSILLSLLSEAACVLRKRSTEEEYNILRVRTG